MAARISPQIKTAEQLLRAQDVGRCELIRGEFCALIPPSFEHGRVAVTIGTILSNYVKAHSSIGVVVSETGFWIARNPDTVRAPDVAFLRSSRAAGPARGYYEGPPDLAVEVRSPDDRPGYVREKTAEWLESGVVVVWNVDPIARTVTVHEHGAAVQSLGDSDTLRCPKLLPEFEVSVAEILA